MSIGRTRSTFRESHARLRRGRKLFCRLAWLAVRSNPWHIVEAGDIGIKGELWASYDREVRYAILRQAWRDAMHRGELKRSPFSWYEFTSGYGFEGGSWLPKDERKATA